MGSVGMGRPGPGRCTRGVWGLETGARAAHTGSVGAGDQALGAACGPLSLVPLHQGQVQSGLRSGIRIAQGSYFRVTLLKATPVQVDGEPWVQAPGHLIISAAGPKVHQGGLGTGLVAGGQSSHGWFFSDPERSRGRIRQPALSHHSVPFCETG